MQRWSSEQVLGLASDAASVRAGQGLARIAKWSSAGCDERAVWGLCQGSGAKPYQTSVDLDGPAFRCSCPSRKFPCKHALGLLLLWSAGVLPAEAEPAWVASWLADREARAGKADQTDDAKTEKTAEPADPEAAAKRAAMRADRVASGVAELEAWLADQIRHGLSGFEHRGYDELGRLAARMVDAQAPGLAGAIRRAAGVIGRGEGWPGALLEELALIHLTVQAHARLGELPAPLAETVRARIGWTVETARVRNEGEKVDDEWLMLGQVVEPDDRLTVRRVWLRGGDTGRIGLILNFAAPGRQLDLLPGGPGDVVPGTLAYYPGALPMRALLTPTAEPKQGARPTGTTVDEALASFAEALGTDPWNERLPFVLAEVRPARRGTGWALVDAAGDAVPLFAGVDPWPLLAVSAGEALTVAGEWNRAGFRPVTCWHQDRAVALA
ncbi:SWIM zinc finger family protein [Kribbella deserti]|uniref:SWIM zinc finger domain-containing protein n=1 Tax=Kribbella deserti TaxID=1926257 RepID=A0ABV6QJ39_9ACTN